MSALTDYVDRWNLSDFLTDSEDDAWADAQQILAKEMVNDDA